MEIKVAPENLASQKEDGLPIIIFQGLSETMGVYIYIYVYTLIYVTDKIRLLDQGDQGGQSKVVFFVQLSLTLCQVLRSLSHLKGNLGWGIGVLLAEILELKILGVRLISMPKYRVCDQCTFWVILNISPQF